MNKARAAIPARSARPVARWKKRFTERLQLADSRIEALAAKKEDRPRRFLTPFKQQVRDELITQAIVVLLIILITVKGSIVALAPAAEPRVYFTDLSVQQLEASR